MPLKSFEDVVKHADSLSLPASTGKAATAADFCTIYKSVRPILEFVVTFPFLPAKWKAALSTLLQAADAMCP